MTLASMIGQSGTGTGSRGPPIRYDALSQALAAVGARAAERGASVHLPRIGTGLAGGEWERVEPLLLQMLAAHPGVEMYVYDHD